MIYVFSFLLAISFLCFGALVFLCPINEKQFARQTFYIIMTICTIAILSSLTVQEYKKQQKQEVVSVTDPSEEQKPQVIQTDIKDYKIVCTDLSQGTCKEFIVYKIVKE
jgi:hypothetical protein